MAGSWCLDVWLIGDARMDGPSGDWIGSGGDRERGRGKIGTGIGRAEAVVQGVSKALVFVLEIGNIGGDGLA